MKLSKFLFDYLLKGEYWYELPSRPTQEYFPFDVTDEELKDDEKLEEKYKKWVTEHDVELVEKKVTYTDLEKEYEEVDVIFRFDGRFYGFSCCYSMGRGWTDDDECIGTWLDEYIAVEKKVIVYEKKC